MKGDYQGPPRIKAEREDWRELSDEERLQVALVCEDLAQKETCSIRVQEYVRRHRAR